MSATTTKDLDSALRGLSGHQEIPELVTVAWVARTFHLTSPSVLYAIKHGRLPAERVCDAEGKVVAYSIKPSDAFLLWSHRLVKQPGDKT